MVAGVLGSAGSYVGKGVAGALTLGYFGIWRRLQYPSRMLVYVLVMAITALFGAVESVILTLIGKQGLSQWVTARVFYFLCRTVLGLRVEVRNGDRMLERPAVFVSNHQSMLDIYILGAMFPKWCSVTAKRSLQWYPFLGWFMMASGTVFIDRARRENALKAFESARHHVLTKKQSVFMFPEGTRSNAVEPMMLPFKKGAFHFAQQCQIPIVPFVVANYSTLWSKRKQIATSGVIPIEVLEPIPTKGLESKDVNALLEKTRGRMLEATERLGYAKSD